MASEKLYRNTLISCSILSIVTVLKFLNKFVHLRYFQPQNMRSSIYVIKVPVLKAVPY